MRNVYRYFSFLFFLKEHQVEVFYLLNFFMKLRLPIVILWTSLLFKDRFQSFHYPFRFPFSPLLRRVNFTSAEKSHHNIHFLFIHQTHDLPPTFLLLPMRHVLHRFNSRKIYIRSSHRKPGQVHSAAQLNFPSISIYVHNALLPPTWRASFLFHQL